MSLSGSALACWKKQEKFVSDTAAANLGGDEIAIDIQTLKSLPSSATVRRLVFETLRGSAANVVCDLPAGAPVRVVELKGDAIPATALSSVYRVLTIPLSRPAELLDESQPNLQAAMAWAATGVEARELPVQLMTFQGIQICWTRRRFAILAEEAKIESLVRTLMEYAYYESELDAIEKSAADNWPGLERDLPSAWEFKTNQAAGKEGLAKRFASVMLDRARLARVLPYAHSPHQHPPTLASQVAERLRERGRMSYRHEALVEQLEVYQQVYELCGDRANEYQLTRSSNTLEWIIIVMLFAQLIIAAFDILNSYGS